MGMKTLAQKVSDYSERLARQGASGIKPEHVLKVLTKLRHQEAALVDDIAAMPPGGEQQRVKSKLDIARQHIARAEWLLSQVQEPD